MRRPRLQRRCDRPGFRSIHSYARLLRNCALTTCSRLVENRRGVCHRNRSLLSARQASWVAFRVSFRQRAKGWMVTATLFPRLGLGLALAWASLAVPVSAAGDPVVTVESGKLQGVAETGPSPLRIF